MTWLLVAVALAEPGRLLLDGRQEVPLPVPSHIRIGAKGGTRFAVTLGDRTIQSPLVWEKPTNKCDGDEAAVGDGTPGTGRVPTWCAEGGRDGEPDVPRLTFSVEGSFDLRNGDGGLHLSSAQLDSVLKRLDSLGRVWEHGHFEGTVEGRVVGRIPCVVTSDISWHGPAEKGFYIGLSDAAHVQVGWLKVPGMTDCRVHLNAGKYDLDPDCKLEAREGGTHDATLYLFPFARNYTDQCEKLGEQGPWGAKVNVRLEARPPETPEPAGRGGSGNGASAGGTNTPAGGGDTGGPPGWIWALASVPFVFGAVLFRRSIATGLAIPIGVLIRTLQRAVGPETTHKRTPKKSPIRPAAGPAHADDTRFVEALREAARDAWARLGEDQRATLRAIASGRPDYIANVTGSAGNTPLAKPRLDEQWRETLQSSYQQLRGVELGLLNEGQVALAVAVTVETLAEEAWQFQAGFRPNYKFAARNGPLMAVLVHALKYSAADLRSATAGRAHPAALLACRVLEAVGGRPPEPEEAAATPGDAGSASGEDVRVRDLVHALAQAQANLDASEARALRLQTRLHDADATLASARAATATRVAELEERAKDGEGKMIVLRSTYDTLHAKYVVLTREVEQLRAKLAELEAREALRRKGEEEARKAREDKLQRGDARHLVECLRQVYTYGALREAVRHTVEMCEQQARGGMAHACAELLDESDRLRRRAREETLAGKPAYLEEWQKRDDDLRRGHATLVAFVEGAREIENETDAERLVERLLHAAEAYAPIGAGQDAETWGRGFRAWLDVFRLAERPQGDDGAALGSSLKQQAFELVLVPWLRLAQFVAEALPVEVGGKVGNMAEALELQVERRASLAFERLGYQYEHVPLYKANRRDFITRRSLVAVSPVTSRTVWFDLERPAAAERQTVVRVLQPLIVQGPAGHIVRAQVWCLEDETNDQA